MRYCSIVIAALFSFFPVFVYAEVGGGVVPPVVPSVAASDPFSTDALAQLLLGLLGVVALILFLAWIAKRAIGMPQSGRHMRIVTGLPLGTREKIVLVEVGKEQLLLGVAPGRVSLLTRFDEPVVKLDVHEDAFGQRIMEALQRRQGS